LDVEDLRTYFYTRDGVARAVDGVSFSVDRGETLGIVGESGCGKSVTCYSLLGLIRCPPGRIDSGIARFDGIDLLSCSDREIRKIRGDRISMIFQDPMTGLNPYLPIGIQVMEPLLIHAKMSRREAREKAIESLEEVGIQDAGKSMKRYPHQFSGGMQQRAMIAMALITEPELLIADEPTTALDVSIQAQIIDLIGRIQGGRHVAVIFITHDLGVIAGVSDRILVMYNGRIIESGDTRSVYYTPGHPYTRALMASIPATRGSGRSLYVIPGMPPDNAKPLPGCPFAPRCRYAADPCRRSVPRLERIAPKRRTACLRIQEGSLQMEPIAGGSR